MKNIYLLLILIFLSVGNIFAQLNGTKTIGSSGDYKTLTSAFADITSKTLDGNLNLILQADYSSASETFPIAGPTSASVGSYTVTIYPGITGLSITSSNATGTINLSGSKNIIFDGRVNAADSDKDLIIENTNTSGYVIQLINNATYNTFKYCKIKGVNSSVTSGNILFKTSGGSAGNNFNTIDNCDIFDGSSTPVNSIYASGTSGKENTNNTISNNNIYNFYCSSSAVNGGTGISINSFNNTWSITGNSFYQTTQRTAFTNAAIMYAIYINYNLGNSFSVSDNYIGGAGASCGIDSMKICSPNSIVFHGIYMNVGTTTASSVQNNVIRNISFTSSATNLWYGMYFGGGKINIGTVNGNIIGSETGNGSVTITTITNGSASTGIFTTGTNATYVVSNNKVGAINIAGASVNHSFTGISNAASSSTVTISSNYIGSAATASSIQTASQNNSSNFKNTSLVGISNSPNVTNLNISNNIVYNLTNNYYYSGNGSSYNGVTRGIQITNGTNVTVSGNTIRNLSSTCAYFNSWIDDNSANITGIHAVISGGTVSQNTVYALKHVASNNGIISGIYLQNSSTSAYISKNFVHSLSSTYSGLVYIKGITTSGATTTQTTYVTNNMVRLGIDTYGNSLTNSHLYIGIYQYSGNFGANDRFYHNSVYIGGTNTGNSASTYAFYTSVLNNTRELYNNIFCNERSYTSASVSNFNYACGYSGYLPIPRGASVNYNLYYTSGTGGKLFYSTTTSTGYSTLNAWRTANYSIDSNSAVGNPNFINPTGDSNNVNLHVQNPTPVEASGILISTVTDDFDGQTRSGLSPIDIGADAGNFTITDIFGPKILFTDIPNTTSTSNLVLNNFVTITDNVGVSTGVNLPRLYFKKSTDADAFGGNTSSDNGWKYAVASNSSSPFSFTIDTSIINGGSVSIGDIIQYFVVAQDDADNLSSQPFAATAFGNPPVQNIIGKTTPVKTYSIYTNLSGTVTVGIGGNYPTLTGSGGLFEAINYSNIAGNITANIISDITETGTNCLYQWTETGFGGFTLTIQPDGDTLRNIFGTAINPHQPMININGANRVTIDGGSGKYLKFRNTNSNNQITGPTVQFDNGSANCTITNCTIENNSKSGFCGTVTIGTNGTNNVTINNNDIRNPSGGSYTEQPFAQIFSNSATNTVTITGNNIYNFEAISNYGGYGVYLNNVANGCNISNNSIYNTVGTINGGTSGIYGIFIYAGSNHTVSQNFIGGTAPNCGGTPFIYNYSSSQFSGIYLYVGSSVATSVQGNRIQNITCNASSFYGIACFNGLANIGTVTANTIGHPANANSIQYSGTGAIYGVYAQGSSPANVENNIISNITLTAAGSSQLMGIYSYSGHCRKNRIYNLGSSQAGASPTIYGIQIINLSSTTLEFSNNQISLNGGSATNPANLVGINSISTSNASNIYFNTIYISGAATTSSSACLKKTSTGVNTLKNNIFYNARTTSGAGIHYSVSVTNKTNFTSSSSNYNFFVSADQNKVCEWGTGVSKTFSDWKISSLGDTSSCYNSAGNINPANFFTDAANGNLNIISNNVESWYVKGKGVPITGFGSDISGNTRSEIVFTGATSIGANEFTPSQGQSPINATPVLSGTNTITFCNRNIVSITWGSGGTVPTNIAVQYFSGVNPGGNPTGNYGNVYWLIEATGGSGYTYDITLYYDAAIIGTIGGESNVRLAKRPTGGGSWNAYSTSTVDTSAKTVTFTGLNSFSEFALSDYNSPMPVSLYSFTYNVNLRDVNLKWVTSSEFNNSGFEIQRTDYKSKDWQKVGFVNGSGTTNTQTSYSFAEKKLSTGKYKYRLKQIDFNGNFEYHNLNATVEIGVPTKFDLSQNYPNPFNPTTKIDFQIPNDSKVTLKIYDLTGKEIATLLNNEFKSADYYTVTFNGVNLASGMYFYRITTDKFTSVKKMMMIK